MFLLVLLISCTEAPIGDSGRPGDGGAVVTDSGDSGNQGGDGGALVDPDHVFVSSDADWTAVSAGSQHACGQRQDGSLRCWGYDWDGRTTVPTMALPVRDFAAGGSTTCAIDGNGGLHCWGEDGPVLTDVPGGAFAQVEAGYDFACALNSSGRATCWGDDEHGQLQAPTDAFLRLSTGRTHACGLREDGAVLCWGGRDPGAVAPDPGGLPPPHDGEVADYGQAVVPEGSWLDVAAGDYHTCLIEGPDQDGGSVRCWGQDRAGEITPDPGLRLDRVYAGGVHSCGLDPAGRVHCWGAATAAWDYHQALEPPGVFAALDLATVYTCGLRTPLQPDDDDGLEIACWGALDDLPVQVP